MNALGDIPPIINDIPIIVNIESVENKSNISHSPNQDQPILPCPSLSFEPFPEGMLFPNQSSFLRTKSPSQDHQDHQEKKGKIPNLQITN